MATKVIESLITQLGFDYDDKELGSFNEGITKAAKGALALVTAASAASVAIFAFTKKIASSNDELGKFALTTGIDVEALQEFGYVAEIGGASADAMNSSLANLSKTASEAARGMGAGVEVFGMLGLSATDASGKVKDADQLFLELSDSISSLGTQAEKLEFAQKLGIDQSLILTLDQGSNAIQKLRQDAQDLGFVIGTESAQAAAEFNDSLLDVTKVIRGLANVIGTRLMKVITPMMDAFTDWFKANREIIKQNLIVFFERLVEVIRAVFGVVMRVASFVNTVAQAFGGWENTIKLVTAAMIALNASVLLIPALVTAAAVAIFLLLEDLMVFAQGGESALGALAEKFPVLEPLIRGLANGLAMIAEGWRLIFTQGDEAFEGMVMMLQDAFQWIKNLGSEMANFGKSILEFYLKPIQEGIDLLNNIPGVSIPGGTNVPGNVSPVPDSGVGGLSTVSNNSTTNNTSSPNISIAINGGNTAEVEKTVMDVLNNQYSGAATNFSTKVEQ